MLKTMDVVTDLYLVAEALRYLSETFPEEMGGIAYLLKGLSETIKALAEEFDERLR